MLLQLSPLQARVIGVLIEKEITTPDQYPLSLNAIMLGCNQKSSRDPVLQLSETDVQNILDELAQKNLLFEHQASGSRVVKYKHRFCNTEFSSLQFSPQQLSIICVLLLRGPQTPGELRTRTNRLAEFANVNELEKCLHEMLELNGEKLIVKLEREPGKREARYAHLFSGSEAFDPITESAQAAQIPQGHHTPETAHTGSLQDALKRIETLEGQIERLHTRLNDMQENIDILSG